MRQGKVEICGVDTSSLTVLPEERKRELLRQARAGNKEAREELIMGNLRLVLRVIQRFNTKRDTVDDLFQVGCIGLIKSIEYSMMFYIVAEYKNISVTKAMKISMIITRGHKMDLFVLALSFFGWILLSCLTLGIGLIFLQPYMELTYVNTFHDLLQEAIEKGSLRLEDLDDNNM